MKPVQFKYANQVLEPSGQTYSGDVKDVSPLPIWTNGEQCVSCWKMSFWERISALLFGRVWLAVLSKTQPPVCLQATDNYLMGG